MWRCDYGSSLGPSLLKNADVLDSSGCIHKFVATTHWEKGHDTAYRMAMTFGTKKRSSTASIQLICIAFVMRCQFVISDLWPMNVSREDCDMSAWWHIGPTKNEFLIWVSLPLTFQDWGCGMKHHPWNMCTKDNQQRQKLWLLLFFSPHAVTSSTIFRGHTMPQCVIVHTHSPKACTTLWIITICIASMERVFVSTVTQSGTSWMFPRSSKANFDVKMV